MRYFYLYNNEINLKLMLIDQPRISPWTYTPCLNLMETFWGWTWVMIVSLANLLNSRSCKHNVMDNNNNNITCTHTLYVHNDTVLLYMQDAQYYNIVKIIEITMQWDDQCRELTCQLLCIQCVSVSKCVCVYTSILMTSDCGFSSEPSSGATDSVQFKGNAGPRQR